MEQERAQLELGIGGQGRRGDEGRIANTNPPF